MFQNQERVIYRNNQLGDVICQLRFPEILTIETTLPAAFQETIRDEFPLFSARKENPAPKLSGTPGNLTLEKRPQTNNYQFASADGVWRVNLTSKFISLACSRYTCWEDFAKKLDKPLASFIKLYKPAFFERVGLRYLNFFSRKKLGLEGTPFSELITASYLGILSEEDVSEGICSRSSMDAEITLRGGCKCKLHAGPGLVKIGGVEDQEPKFILDQDLFMSGNVPVNYSAGALESLHSQAYTIFRSAVTELCHRAMEPEDI